MNSIKLILTLFFLRPLICFAQLGPLPIEKFQITNQNILDIVPNAQSKGYSYFKKELGVPLTGSEIFNKFDQIVSIGDGEEIAIFESHTSYSIKSVAKSNVFLLSCTCNTLSFNGGGLSFQQAIIKKNKGDETIVELIKDVELTASDVKKMENSGLSLEDFVNSESYTKMPQKTEGTNVEKKDLSDTPKIDLPSSSQPDQSTKEYPAVAAAPIYGSVKILWLGIGITLSTLSIILLFVYRKTQR
jgi:hypothetical protein